MNKKKFIVFRMAVLIYYRSEWTDVKDDDADYKFILTKEINELIMQCFIDKTNISNAAAQVKIFIDSIEHTYKKSKE